MATDEDGAVDRATLDEIKGLIDRGELVGAYDRARACLDAGQDHPRLRYLSVLALARSGATARAAAQYREMQLQRQPGVDPASLWARILKDAALVAPRTARPRLLARAARAYGVVFHRTGDYFPGINAATLLLLSGRTEVARAAAQGLLRLPQLAEPRDYWSAASRAEALVLLGRWDEAADALGFAKELWDEAARRSRASGQSPDFGAVASTRRQLAILLDFAAPEPKIGRELLGRLRLPRVAHLCAPEIAADDAAARLGMREALHAQEVGFGVGALWTTGALVAAEEVLARGAELHLVLPFGADDYRTFMARTRPDEVERRGRCLALAATVTFATSDGDLADPQLVGYAALIAAGLAETRARRLSTECVRVEIAPSGQTSPPRPRDLIASEPETGMPAREMRAILFADVYRFSSIPESRLPAFWSAFMGGLAAAIDEAGASVLYRNTWGDALVLIIAEIQAAADLAMALQERATELRRTDRSTPELRIGLHHGPVFKGFDPIRRVPAYFGTQVSRAARVEPIAPPGAVFVTEPFAAILAAGAARDFDTEYVGLTPLPKKYGEHRMYRLARRPE